MTPEPTLESALWSSCDRRQGKDSPGPQAEMLPGTQNSFNITHLKKKKKSRFSVSLSEEEVSCNFSNPSDPYAGSSLPEEPAALSPAKVSLDTVDNNTSSVSIAVIPANLPLSPSLTLRGLQRSVEGSRLQNGNHVMKVLRAAPLSNSATHSIDTH